MAHVPPTDIDRTTDPVTDPAGPRAIRIPADTDAEAHAMQRAIYRRMSGAARVAAAFRLSEAVARIAIAGIRARHPHYTDDQIRFAYARLKLGDDLVRAVWPERELVAP